MKSKDQPSLIGPAAGLIQRLSAHAAGLSSGQGQLKWLLFGPPGTGKTTIANAVSRALASSPFEIDSINGRDLTIEVVRKWIQAGSYASLWGSWKVKIVNEVDLVPMVAQDLMLTYMDELPDRTAIIATSNLDGNSLTERFKTRFTHTKVDSPTDEEIAKHIQKRHRVPLAISRMIAMGSLGNVRAAEKQAEGYTITGEITEIARPAAPVVCASASLSAKKAWETRRSN